MKRYNNLFDKIVSYDNFLKAYNNATKGKKHYREVIEIEKHKEEYLRELALSVKNKTYEVSPYTFKKIYSGGKIREISKLPMRDRIVQHAFMIHLEEIFRKSFIQDTYSSIKGRGIHRGLKRVKRALKDPDAKYVLLIDIHKCYPSLDLSILKEKLKKKFKDRDVQWYLCKIVDSHPNGIPIGNYTSQYFNNYYFSDLDHWIKEVKRVKHYFRYCDDIVIISKYKSQLWALFKEILHRVADLKVKLKSNYRLYPIESGINFLGYVTYTDHRLLRKHIKCNFIKKCRCINFKRITEHLLNVLGSYWGILLYGNCKHLWFKYTQTKVFKDLK